VPAELAQAGFVELWHPRLLAVVVLLAAAYLWAVGPGRRHLPGAGPVHGRQVAAFLGALATLYLAVGTPLDVLSDEYLYSAHMVEHMLLTYVLPPLVWLGTPGWLLRPALRLPAVGRAWRRLTRPLLALGLFNVTFSLIHVPAIYDLALGSEILHFCEHALMVSTALLLWWPVLSPLPELPRLPDGPLLLYLFANEVFQDPVVALITFASHPLYPAYATAPRIWGISPLADQQLGGILMKVGAMVSLGPALWLTFFRWARQEGQARIDPQLLAGRAAAGPALGATGRKA
jgi:putative membrane protein